VPQDDTIVKIGHSLRGDIILKIVQQMNSTTTNGVGVAAERISDPSSSMLLPPYGIHNESMYTLHTLSQNAATMQDVMIKLDVPAISASSIIKTQPMRSLWIDFVRREWPYDGNGCQCLQDENGCQRNNNYTVATTTASGGSSSGGKSGTGSSTTNTVEDHGGGGATTHISDTPSSKNSHHSSSKSSSNGASGMAVVWVTIIAGVVFFFFTLRRSRRQGSSSTPVRRSELEGSNDLELQESSAASGAYGMSAGGGYSSPDMPSRGTFV